MAIAHRILRDAHLAEDAVQSALVVAWRELRTLRDPDRFEPWLHRILTNECYAEARRRTRWSANIRLLPVDESGEPPGILTVDDRDQLERAFRRLTLEQRAVLVFHHYLDLPLPEVAAASASRSARRSPDSITRRRRSERASRPTLEHPSSSQERLA